jgi:succinate-semialdehyde dehydrogenase / glutarate-semialdehyde dehydrogenase
MIALKDKEMNGLRDEDLFRQQCLIAGEWRRAASGARVEVTDPATQEVIGTVPDVSGAETRSAIDAASAALASWRGRTHAERAALLGGTG